MGDRYFLSNPKILEQWAWATTLRRSSESIDLMPQLRKMLIEEYTQIIDKHLKGFSDIVPKIPLENKA
jgi:hypothetical protein